ncbi:MAG: serine/threonine protein kinase, partial [Myxococcales bacterium]|nr:serine/threonine protein kinase [Myxococcales bacterium]
MADPAPTDDLSNADDDAAFRAASLVGQRIDKYQIVRILGRGGMGCVYEAVNTVIDKRVALKCIAHALAIRPDAVLRFQREALAASAVESANIVQIFDAGTTDAGLPYIVMELMHGEDLGSHLVEVGKLATSDAVEVMAQILRGLHHA